jgi:hypothetical protein
VNANGLTERVKGVGQTCSNGSCGNAVKPEQCMRKIIIIILVLITFFFLIKLGVTCPYLSSMLNTAKHLEYIVLERKVGRKRDFVKFKEV